jgi:hypothetical protein
VEAAKVAVVRQTGRLPAGQLRAELPRVYTEMAAIRRAAGRGKSTKSALDYPVARFVVELVTLIQSDLNTKSPRFRLEAAVLENTKDPRKAIFLPNDVRVGYGEGTYYQALPMVSPRCPVRGGEP